jgi:Flp pilus assembly protein TadD
MPMKILFLHGWHSTPGGVKPTYLKDHRHEVLNPALSDDDFDAAVRIAQAEFDKAILDFTEAIRLNPSFGEAYQQRGLAYEKSGEKAKAEEDFAQAKKLGYKAP